MNRSIEFDLSSLLPSYAGPLPSELVDLAQSLLAQSHTRISNLKPQEETARAYVCANLACERLKNQLDLPLIIPKPPLQKRTYEKLYTYFQTALPPTSTTRTRNTLAASALSSPVKPGRLTLGASSALGSPAKTVRLGGALPPASALRSPSKTIRLGSAAPSSSAPRSPAKTPTAPSTPTGGPTPSRVDVTRPPSVSPDTLDPVLAKELKELSTRLSAPNALHHMLTGVANILAAPENSRVHGSKKVYAIVAAVTVLVIERLAPSEGQMRIGNIGWEHGVGYKAKKEEVMDSLAKVASGAVGLSAANVDDWVQRMGEEGFRRWAWMEKIPEGGGSGADGSGRVSAAIVESPARKETNGSPVKGRKRKADMDMGAELEPKPKIKKLKADAVIKAVAATATLKTVKMARDVAAAPTPKPVKTAGNVGGGGKMLQDRVDYLSEKKQNLYLVWKKEVLERCDRIDAGND